MRGRVLALLDSSFLTRVGNLRTLFSVVGLGAVVVIGAVLAVVQLSPGRWWVPIVCFVVWLAVTLFVIVSWRRNLTRPAEPEAPAGVLTEDSEASFGGGSPVERLALALAEGMKLRTHLSVWDSPTYWTDEMTGKYDDLPFTEHPVYKWAKATYGLLLDHFGDYADEFFGEGNGLGPAGFSLAYADETRLPKGSRTDYLERRIDLLKRAVREIR